MAQLQNVSDKIWILNVLYIRMAIHDAKAAYSVGSTKNTVQKAVVID